MISKSYHQALDPKSPWSSSPSPTSCRTFQFIYRDGLKCLVYSQLYHNWWDDISNCIPVRAIWKLCSVLARLGAGPYVSDLGMQIHLILLFFSIVPYFPSSLAPHFLHHFVSFGHLDKVCRQCWASKEKHHLILSSIKICVIKVI